MNVREALDAAVRRLEEAHVPDARLDAEYLLAEALQTPRLSLLIDKLRPVPEEVQAVFDGFVSRREVREPLQYILGTQPFMGFSLRTDARALIPRNDTEAVCEAALQVLPKNGAALDLCTGSGALAVAIKKLRPDASVTASDVSADALSLARENAAALGAEVFFAEGDLFAPLKGTRFDLIVSNPPYIPEGLRGELQEEVRKEPTLALFAGVDGLDFYRRIVREAPEHLLPGGWLVLEMGDDQFEAVSAMLTECFEDITLIRDMNGKPRGARARMKRRKEAETDGRKV